MTPAGAAFRVAGLALALAGCGNAGTSLGPLPATQGAAISTDPLYGRFDSFSFSQAVMTYPAATGTHRVQVGSYLMGEIMRAMGGKDVRDVRLTGFEGNCETDGVILPHIKCRMSLTIALKLKQLPRTVRAETQADVGNHHAKTASTFGLDYVDYGEETISGQAKAAVDALLAATLPQISGL